MKEKLSKQKYELERIKRLKESEALGKEYEFLKINKDGFLEKPYPIPGAFSSTNDKVAAASFIKGFKNMEECQNDSLGWAPYYEGRNEIYQIAEREPIYSKEDIEKAKSLKKRYK